MEASRRTLSERSESKGRGCWVYMVKCHGGRLYTGISNDVPRSFQEHQTGGSRFTKGFPAERLIYTEHFLTRDLAMARERQIKGWTRAKKPALAAGDFAMLKHL